jgi:hypothetical protein
MPLALGQLAAAVGIESVGLKRIESIGGRQTLFTTKRDRN